MRQTGAFSRPSGNAGRRSHGRCVYGCADRLHYAVAGDIKIALLRGDELIPLSRGQTLDVLAMQAYEEGRISRQDAVPAWMRNESGIILGRTASMRLNCATCRCS